ncbi:hypothetical protein ACFUJY_14790 [Streptomyces sp. NPDC057249]|uniref:hypothetical protein n=1 Tax=Streptomyces sp. NPDC057249 TaxID=3346067 RepID=UPI003632F5C5
MKRSLAALFVGATVVVAPVVTATTAQASQSSCANYVGSKGYQVGPLVKAACGYPATDFGVGKVANPFCITKLTAIKVKPGVAEAACSRA